MVLNGNRSNLSSGSNVPNGVGGSCSNLHTNSTANNNLIENSGAGITGSQSQLDILGSGTQIQPNAVLRVIIDSMIYPVTLDVLHAVSVQNKYLIYFLNVLPNKVKEKS